MTLLLDPEDTAAGQAAAEHLLARGDATGLRLFAEAFGRAEEAIRNKLADCLYDEPDLWGQGPAGATRPVERQQRCRS